MAESGKITREDIIAKDAFTSAVIEAKQLLDVINEISAALKAKAKNTAEGFAIASPQTIEDVAKLTKQIEDLKKQIEALNAVRERQKKATEAYTQAQAEETLARQKQRQEVTQQVKLNSDLTSTYEKQVVRLAQIKKELKNISAEGGKAPKALTDEFKKLDSSVRKAEEAVGEHTRSVGNYKQALQGLGGTLGNAANGISNLGGQLKSLLTNPYALVIAGIASAVYGLFKAFTSTDSGATEWAVRLEQVSAIIDVVRQRALSLIDALGALFSGDFTEAADKFGDAISTNADDFERATKGARDYIEALDELEDAQSNYLIQTAKANLEISKLEFNAADRKFSIQERRKYLEEAIALSKEEVAQQKKFAEQRFILEVEKIASLSGVSAEEIAIYVESTEAQKKNASEAIKAARNKYEEEFKALNEFGAKVFDEERRFFEENKKNNARLAAFDEQVKKEEEERERKRLEALKVAQEKELAAKKKLQDELDRLAKHNQEEYDKEVKRINDRLKKIQEEADEEKRLIVELIEEADKLYEEAGKDEIDRLQKIADEKLAQERKVQQQILQGIEQGTKRRSEIIQNGLEKEIQKQNEAVEKQQELAAKGLDNTLAYQERKREELQAKLQREQEAERKREEALQLAGAFLGSYQSRLDKNQNSTQALAGALADTLIAKAISSTIAGAFAEGVENFQGKGTGTSDSNLIAFSNGESVVTAKATQKYSGLVTAMNSGSVEDYVKEMILPDMDAPIKVNGNSFQSAAIIYTLNTKLESLEKAIKNKQEVKINWNAHGERVEEVVKDGMKTVIKHVTTGKRRL